MSTNNTKPFGIKDKLGYMFGDFGNDFTFILASMIMMKFYTDVMGVSAALVGTLMMTARFVDAFTDVTMGQIVDRSKPTAAGKFKPWLLRICGPVAVASFLIYGSWFANMGMGFKIGYMFVTYLLWGSVFYTAVNIPYGSMASAISADPEERASLSTFRTMGGALAGLCIGVILPLLIYDKVGDVQVMNGTKVTVAAGVCSVGALLTAIGYVSGSAVGQTEAVKEGIYTLSCLVPGIGFLVLAAITFFFYPLSKKRVDENVKILAANRAGK